jgi:Leucine-rich repeat (LRR) protein
MDVIQQMKGLKTIGTSNTGDFPAAEFWKRYDAGEFRKPAASAKLAYLDPAFQQWIKATQALPAEQQVEAVSKKLQELNPGFDGMVTDSGGKGTPKIENGMVTGFGFLTDNVLDISPVRALDGLKALTCNGTGTSKLSDLSPLKGMNMTRLICNYTPVADLSPLEGMKLTYFGCGGTQVSDLSPLEGMKLTFFSCFTTPVSRLTPLKGMPLATLWCNATKVSDLSPLEGMPLGFLAAHDTPVSDLSALQDCKTLATLNVEKTKVTHAAVAALQKALPNCKIEWDDPAKTTKTWETLAFEQWVNATQALPAEQQIEAVSKKLMELNPGFDGKVRSSKIEKGVVTEVGFFTDSVTDISPVRVLLKLKRLNCNGFKNRKGKLSDLSPLAGMPLTSLDCGSTQVPDLSPLNGMPLVTLYCSGTQISDLSPLEKCKDLKILNVAQTRVTPTQVAALQKALPNCKIEWDDPSKPKTPEPAASGTK